jgi:hypothetical protein
MAISNYLSPEQLQLMLNNTFGDEQNYVRQNPLQFQYPFIPGGITTQFDPRNFQSIFPTSGIRQQVPLQNLGIDTSYGVANEEDVEQEFLPDREPSGIAKLFEFLGKLPTPFNLARRGLESLRGLNDRIQGSDFGQSKTLMEYLGKRQAKKEAERLAPIQKQLREASERGGGYQPTTKSQNVARTSSRVSDGKTRAYGL